MYVCMSQDKSQIWLFDLKYLNTIWNMVLRKGYLQIADIYGTFWRQQKKFIYEEHYS